MVCLKYNGFGKTYFVLLCQDGCHRLQLFIGTLGYNSIRGLFKDALLSEIRKKHRSMGFKATTFRLRGMCSTTVQQPLLIFQNDLGRIQECVLKLEAPDVKLQKNVTF